ncbi:glycoside hydrolase domain-containing protein [Bacillus sp. B15-48]|uniref:glycoside hydrolase domain-containing protein n=1 Tax=Bacillus sp. B15-48 TaxID=1548601 RepID=UPI00193F0242|nr:glycoside hydrolase domain-containing protein [Bacillus sp. B15-48]MBM4765211.1 DUF1906 domain-containing protein [Bacillus sp. B15-48]
MKTKRFLPIGFAVFCTIIISFFLFTFIDSTASKPTEDIPPANESEGVIEDGTTTGDSNVTNNIQNQIDGSKADVTNHVENNTNSDQADISNTIDNNINNSNDNQIDNSVTNNVEVNVNVNVTNHISNNVEGNDSEVNENGQNGENQTGNEQSSNGSENKEGNTDGNGEGIVWGVDSASLTTEEMLTCVAENFGSPEIWGRYLGEKEGVSAGLTHEEAERLHANGIGILVIWNHFTDATGYDNGRNEASAAIEMAREFGVPEGIAIFANIEPIYPVDSEFIKGWYKVMSESEYASGVYGLFDAERELSAAFEQAGQENNELFENTFVWTSVPNVGITTEANAPEYAPEAPENALIGGWQYGIDAETCNIDTNWFNSSLLDVVW